MSNKKDLQLDEEFANDKLPTYCRCRRQLKRSGWTPKRTSKFHNKIDQYEMKLTCSARRIQRVFGIHDEYLAIYRKLVRVTPSKENSDAAKHVTLLKKGF